MKVLLSIKPQHAMNIFNGTKKYEFRRSIFKNSEVKTIIVYASAPLKRVIGEFEIDSIIFEDIEELWDITCEHAGINRKIFFDYFNNKSKGYAIVVKKTRRYRKPKLLEEVFGETPPQSFAYIQSNS